jgi:hypothetical protein
MTATSRKLRRTRRRPDERPPPDTPPTDGKRHVDELLDAALEETFPASDPVAITARG